MNRKAEEAVWAYGPRKLAGALGLTDGAVYHWLRGHSNPKFLAAKKAVKLLEGAASLEDILAAYEPGDRPDRRKGKKGATNG